MFFFLLFEFFYFCSVFREIRITSLIPKLDKDLVLIDVLKSIGFVQKLHNGKNDGKLYYLPPHKSVSDIKVEKRNLRSRLDTYWIMISDIVDIIDETCKLYEKCPEWIRNDIEKKKDNVGAENRIAAIISQSIARCRYRLSPISSNIEELQKELKKLNENVKHIIYVTSNKYWTPNDVWWCLLCGKRNNSVLHNMKCLDCGDISINPHFIAAQTQSMSWNPTLLYGIGTLGTKVEF